MSRTACCLVALGFSVSLAVACGDDDAQIITPGGGSGGSAGTAGSAGRGGTGGGGTGGTAGADGGTGGTAGTAGVAGTGGTAGAAGTAGTGGTGGSDEVPDAGADAAVVTDAGLELTACPADLDDLVNGPTAGATTTAGNHEVIITRLVFDGDEVAVTFRGVIPTGFDFGDPLLLCTGSEPEDCDDGVQELVGTGPAGVLSEGEEVTYTTALGDIVTAASGEIALVNGLPTAPDAGNPNPIVRAYVNWGDYVSLDPEEGDLDSLEVRAADEGIWSEGESVEVDGNTTIYADDDVTGAGGFSVCTAVSG